MIRKLVGVGVLALALSSWGCGKEVKRENPQADTHLDTEPGLFEVTETSEQMKQALAGYHFPDRITMKYDDRIPRCRLMTIRNETDRHFNTNILTDKVRETLTDTGKLIFVADKDRLSELKDSENYEQQSGDVDQSQAIEAGKGSGAAYALIGRLKNLRKANEDVKENTIIFTLELVDQTKRESVIIKSKEFRLSKE
jgi:hypothetical protein